MHTCPHCQQQGISSLQKLCSAYYTPAVCRFCQKRSFLNLRQGIYALIMWVILTWIFIGIALYQQMSIYMIGSVPSLIFVVDKYMLKAPLQRMPA